jgi:sec-independent protein translocase protein TatB
MLDIGWPELFLIAVVTIIVVGPKELPRVVRAVSGMIRKIRGLAGEFQSTLDDMAREADLEDIKHEIERVSKVDLADEFRDATDPSRPIGDAFDFDDPRSKENSVLAEPQTQTSDVGDTFIGDISEHSEKVSPPNSEYTSPKPLEGPSEGEDDGKVIEDSVGKSIT